MLGSDPIALAEAGAATVDELLAQAAHQAALGSDVGARIQEQFGSWQDTADTVALHALLPLALTLLILHEFYAASRDNRAFSVRAILLPLGAVTASLLAYGFVVGLITGVAGSQGEFASWERLMRPVEEGFRHRMERYAGGFELDDLGPFLVWLPFFALVALFSIVAWAATHLLAIAQGTLMAIVLATGKTCLVVSLVPGVSLGKSWAKYLAMLAAWSSVAGAINGVILGNPMIAQHPHLAASGDVLYLIRLAGLYLVYAIFILSVPKITSAIFAGAGSAAPGVLGAVGMGFMAARMATGALKTQIAGGAARAGGAAAGGAGGAAGGRVHKAHRGPTPAGAGGGGRPGRLQPAPAMVSVADAVARSGTAARSTRLAGGASPGGERFGGSAPGRRHVPQEAEDDPPRTDAQFEAYWDRRNAPFEAQEAPPEQTAAMTERVARHGDVLRQAYPDLTFQPGGLAPRERALVDELDQPHGRFAGWERGRLDRHDFAAARGLADRRMLAVAEGVARPASAYAGDGIAARRMAPAVESSASRSAGARSGPSAASSRPTAVTESSAPRPAASSEAGAQRAAPVAPAASARPPEPVASNGRGSSASEREPSARVHARVVPRATSTRAGDESVGRIHKLEPSNP
jgi:hypothetical protein